MPQNQQTDLSGRECVLSVGDRIRLRAVQTARFKSARLSLYTFFPQTRKTAVLAPLMLELFSHGCSGYPGMMEINRRTDELWGSEISLQTTLYGDCMGVGLKIKYIDPAYLPEHTSLLPDLLDLVRRILFYPLTDENGLFPEKTVEKVKRLQCDEIRSLISSPSQYAKAHAFETLFSGRPCGIPEYGSIEETQAVTPEELTGFWREWRKNAFLSCFYVGASAPAEVAETIDNIIGRECPGKTTEYTSFFQVPPPVAAAQVHKIEEHLPIGQGRLILGFQTGGVSFGDPRSTAMDVAAEILGGSAVSFLFMNVREKLSLCYSISAGFIGTRGALVIRCAMEPEKRELAEREIMRQVERLKTGDFSETDLDAARKSLILYFRSFADKAYSMEELMHRHTFTADKRSAEEIISAVSAVTREEVIAAAGLLSLDTVYFLRGKQKGGETDEI